MKYFISSSHDISYNLALEEYIFDTYRNGTYLLLWKNEPSLVIGKFQNVYQEVNLKAVAESDVKIVRRNTGGGTVFHDLGNLNYSLIMDYKPSEFGQYDLYIGPVIRALNQLGVPAHKRNKSDIAVGRQKISGSAQTVFRNRILHHGTLLFDSDLSILYELLKPTSGRIESKSIKSVRSQVVNIKRYLQDPSMTMKELEQFLLQNLFDENMEGLVLSKAEQEAVKERKKKKYDTWEWNYGQSPSFDFLKKSVFGDGEIEIAIAVKKGRITECKLYASDSLGHLKEKLTQETYTGARYMYHELQALHAGIVSEDQVTALTDCFF